MNTIYFVSNSAANKILFLTKKINPLAGIFLVQKFLQFNNVAVFVNRLQQQE